MPIRKQSFLIDKLIPLALVILVLAVYTWATWYFFTARVPGGNDFLTHYGAWEAFIKDGFSPYSEAAALHTQVAIYGRAAQAGEDQNRMVYPFYSILVHGPFVWVDYELARAIYMVFLQMALWFGVWLCLRLLHWRPRGAMLILLFAWSLLDYHQARGVILGQYAIFSFFSLAATIYLLSKQRDGWAGILLTLATIKPTLVFLVAPYLLLWAAFRRRWRFIIGFCGAILVLFSISFLILPTWLSEWLYRIGRYSEYTVGQSPVWLLTHQVLPFLGKPGEIGITMVLVLALLIAWWLALRKGGEKWFYWSLGATLVVSNLMVSRSATTNYVLMLVSILWVFAALDRIPSWGRPLLVSVMGFSLVGMWWLHFVTVAGNQEQPWMFIPEPLILGLVLVGGVRWLLEDVQERKLTM